MPQYPMIHAPSASWGSSAHRPAAWQRALVALAFFGVILLSIGAMVWSIGGVPVRAGAAIAALFAMTAIDPHAAAVALRRQRGLLLLILGVALLGTFVSLLNGMPSMSLLQQIVEIHVQSAVFLLLGAIVAEICGGTAFVLLFVAAVVLSALFAAAQFLGVEAAWSIRDTIAAVTNEPIRYERARPPGLANTPIALATQLTLALAVFAVWRQRLNEAAGAPRRFDPLVLLAVLGFALACLASGNRSPILGAVAFLAIYSAIRAPRTFLLVTPFALLAIPLAGLVMQSLQGTGLRAFTTSDESTEGRAALFSYGVRLFLERPIGYGLGFDPAGYLGNHMDLLMQFPSSVTALSVELHNYSLTMINYYGIGIFLAVPLLFIMISRHATSVLPFLPYVIHILFHNYGPLAKNDALVFLAFAATTMPLAQGCRAAEPLIGGRRSRSSAAAAASYP